jgi:hypothetical protein
MPALPQHKKTTSDQSKPTKACKLTSLYAVRRPASNALGVRLWVAAFDFIGLFDVALGMRIILKLPLR